MKIAVKSVKVARAEGMAHECITETVATLAAATDLLRRWSHTAPKTGGYDKCDFWIEYEDGQVYEGRFDMKYMLADEESLEKHVQSHLMFIAGLWMPSHLTRKKYEDYLRHVGHDECRNTRAFLENYDVGPQVLTSNIDILEAA
jgi:hypothetical protein